MKKRSSKSRSIPQFLSGWKEVANYLGRGVRTVQRYERELGLPVRRPAGKLRASVVATKAELDAWISARPIREAFHLTRQNPASEFSDTTKALREGLAQMSRLRQQMATLHSDLKVSVQLLSESVYDLQGGLQASEWREGLPSPVVFAPQARSKRALEITGRSLQTLKVS